MVLNQHSGCRRAKILRVSFYRILNLPFSRDVKVNTLSLIVLHFVLVMLGYWVSINKLNWRIIVIEYDKPNNKYIEKQ